MFHIDAFKVSWLYKEGLEDGEAKGEAKGEARGEAKGEARGEARGEAKGILEGKRGSLRHMLAKKFPKDLFPELDQVHELGAIDDLFLAVAETTNSEQARSAILGAVRPQ